MKRSAGKPAFFGAIAGLVLSIPLANCFLEWYGSHSGTTINGWSVHYNVGRYGNDFLTRALIAKVALGANLPEDSLYYFASSDQGGKPLDGSHSYRMRFEKDNLPSAKGFWSLTMYRKSDYMLVDNVINRYSIGDRTSDLHFGNDGSLVVSIQPDRPTDAANWLPSPTDNFVLILRAFEPDSKMLAGRWEIPAVERCDKSPTGGTHSQ